VDLNSETNPQTPAVNPLKAARSRSDRGFHEGWFLKLNDRSGTQALWLRFTTLVTHNGFQRIAETWAVFFQRAPGREITKSALRQRYPISAFSRDPSAIDSSVRVADCLLSRNGSRGSVQFKGRAIQWDLRLQDVHEKSICFVPESLKRLGIIKNDYWTLSENLHANGTVTVDGTVYEFKDSTAMLAHISGPKSGHSWVWGQANSFVDDKGQAVPFVFEGITAKSRLPGSLNSPRMSSFYFFYRGQHYQFSSVWDALHLKSKSTITEWNFQADRGDLSFRGTVKAEHKDFAGLTYEDTDGSLLYCANSKLSTMTVHVYRRGKLEATLVANGTAAFEVVSRRKNPYIKTLI